MSVLSFPIVLAACLAGVACSKSSDERAFAPQPSGPAGTVVAPLTVTSTAFEQGGTIPSRFTCEGANVSPPLSWSDPPGGTKSFVVMIQDPDAPSKTFTHWIVYDLPASARSLPGGTKNAPPGAHDATNDFGREEYGGPCPPSGQHHYVFHVYALDVPLSLAKAHAADVMKAMNGHVLAEGALTATYAKGGGSRT